MTAKDSAVRARVAGREAMAARVVWELHIGNFGFRCVSAQSGDYTVGGRYVVQGRMPEGWTEVIGTGSAPAELLAKVATSDGVSRAISEMAERKS